MKNKNFDGNNPLLEEDDETYQEDGYQDDEYYDDESYDEDYTEEDYDENEYYDGGDYEDYQDDEEYYDDNGDYDEYYDDGEPLDDYQDDYIEDGEYFDEEDEEEEKPKKSKKKSKKESNPDGTNGIFAKRTEPLDDDDDEYDDDEDDYDDDDEDDDDDYEDERPKRRVKRKIKGLRLSLALIMTFIILGVSALLSIIVIYLAKEYMGVDKSTTTYIINIPEGSTTDEITDILYDNSIIKIKDLFKLAVRLNADDDSPIVAGEHQISPSMDYGDIIEELQTNIQDSREVVTITFPEGINVYEAGDMLEEEGVCDARKFVYYFKDGFDISEYKFSSYLPTESTLKFIKLEGYLFPDTYEFYKDEDAEIVARKIFDNFDSKFTDEYYSRMNEIGMSLDEVITLASIVQKEAGNVSDMKLISSVFHNRLNAPDLFPMLQSDPTRIYSEDVIHQNLDVANTTMEDAYNTYKSAGLPPGAICNPGIDAIEAVLYPADTNYYYFCADVETGETFYANDLETHNANLELAGISID
jgi:UPF0755 protein